MGEVERPEGGDQSNGAESLRDEEISKWNNELCAEFDLMHEEFRGGEDSKVMPNIPPELHTAVFRRCFDTNVRIEDGFRPYSLDLAQHLNQFESVDKDMAIDLLNDNIGLDDILPNIDKFQGLDQQGFVTDLIRFYSDPHNTRVRTISGISIFGYVIAPLSHTLRDISDNFDRFNFNDWDPITQEVDKLAGIRTKGKEILGFQDDIVGYYAEHVRGGKGSVMQDEKEQLAAIGKFLKRIKDRTQKTKKSKT